ncbi:MAG: ABC transporter ATP-binding protein [Chloroflexota bacterium]
MESLKRIATYMKPYKLIVFFGFITTVLPVVMELLVPRILQTLIDDGIRGGDLSVITSSAWLMLGAALVGAIATLGQGYCRAQLSQGLSYDLRNDLFRKAQSFSFANLDQIQTGQLMTRLSADVDVVRLFSSSGLALLLRTSLMVLGSLIMVLITDWQLAMVMVVVLILASFIIRWLFRIARPMFAIVQAKLDGLNTAVQENLAGVKVVKAFVREKYSVDYFADYNEAYMDENIKVGRIVAVAMPTLTVITNLGIVGIIWLGGLDVIEGRISIGTLVAFNNYLMIGMMPLLFLSNLLNMVSRADASADRLLEVLDTTPAIVPPASPHQADMKGQITFHDVSFQYNKRQIDADFRAASDHQTGSGYQNGATQSGDRNEAVLNRVNFQVQAGQQVALMGATGSGKSTLISLIPRFYDVTDGQICIDDIDVRDWDLARLRQSVALVQQQTILFRGTIRENIAYGDPTASDERVIAAAKAAQAHDFISALPNEYDSHIEERGLNLSGGQKQRISIARALLVNPTILILDDSTSAVDMETEFKLQQALETLMKGRTTFIIAQRITSVLNADQIIILDAGQVVAQGTHQELLENNTIYQEIYHSQLGDGQLATPVTA